MSSKFIDISSVIQVVGCVYNEPNILEQTDKYSITDEDFTTDLHKIVFGTIYKLHESGVKAITLEVIDNYLSERPKSYGIYKENKGAEWILKASENAQLEAFDYYYNRMKKMTLLRAYDTFGFDVSDIYDPNNILDVKKKQKQEDFLNNSSLEKIALIIDEKIDKIKEKYINDSEFEQHQAGDGIFNLINRLKEYPEVGVPLYGNMFNMVTRGARLKKFYLRSAPTGMGKTRSMIADVCHVGCNKYYDEMFGWIKNGTAEPVLYITTEQELEEIQTMMWAFISGVDEDHIMNNRYEGDEEARVDKAIEILARSKIYIIELPDFSLRDVENLIKQNIRENGVKYVCFDYIMTSLKILEEIASRTGGVKLREDNILFMLSRRLKDLANEYGVFILSGTQLNADWRDSETPDQNLLRGAKSIADSIDLGMHILPVVQKDLEGLETVLAANTFDKPNVKISVYKNRRGRYKGVYLWTKADYGTCRFRPMFATTWDYEIITIEDLKIITEEIGAFEGE